LASATPEFGPGQPAGIFAPANGRFLVWATRHPGSGRGATFSSFRDRAAIRGGAAPALPERVFKRRVLGAGTFAAIVTMSEDELFAGWEG
jgi:hypothetical protein